MGHRRPPTCGEQPERLLQPTRDLLDREHLRPRRCEFYCKGYPVEAVANLRDGHRVALRDLEARPESLRPLDEEPRRLVAGQALQGRQVTGVGQGEGRNDEEGLT